MKYQTAILATLAVPAMCLAFGIGFGREIAILNRLGTAAMNPQTSVIALDLLERVALGKANDIRAEWETQVGVPAGRASGQVVR